MILAFIICSAFGYRSDQECICKDSFLDLILSLYLFCLRIQIGGIRNNLVEAAAGMYLKSDGPRYLAEPSLK